LEHLWAIYYPNLLKNGGLGLGTVGTSMLFLAIIVSLVIYLSLKQKKQASLPINQQH
jgi:uncharacterized membrane-anchored protein